jgi:tRNA-splicing ligase RtcB
MDTTLRKVDEYIWEVPPTGDMRVPGRIYADVALLDALGSDQSLGQVCNVAHLPGIRRYSLAMPDIHFGYGFPIGGVAAFGVDDGVVSPGGVGYDINCGVRLLATDLTRADVEGKMGRVVDQVFRDVPSGVGSHGAIQKLDRAELTRLVVRGAAWAVEHGFGRPRDLEYTESEGTLPGADPDALSDRAFQRGLDQVGTLGSGNHFLEVQVVDQIFDPVAARAFGLFEGASRYGIELPDRQLACAPVRSPEAERYLGAMACAANYAWANRQMIMHLVKEALLHALSIGPKDLGLRLVYDVAHNIAKIEEHTHDDHTEWLCVHRKGATRAFAPGHSELPAAYRDVGQPVLIPGDMGTASFVCRGTQAAMDQTFGSTCHGAGRVLSRSAAIKRSQGRSIERELAAVGVTVRSQGRKTLQEELPEAYKDVEAVVRVMDGAGISPRVARLRPLGVVKG